MTPDRELLEAAARAAGIEQFEGTMMWKKGYRAWDGAHWYPWNPLTDDGDALRLAVKLRIEVYEGTGDGPEAWAGFYTPDRQRQRFVTEPHGTDPYAATRRAIVRAAAAIGEKK